MPLLAEIMEELKEVVQSYGVKPRIIHTVGEVRKPFLASLRVVIPAVGENIVFGKG